MTKNKFVKNIRENKGILTGMCILDNIAWIAFAWAMTLAPIGIVVALSESYIIIAVLLGMFVNREFLRKHQKIGRFMGRILSYPLRKIKNHH